MNKPNNNKRDITSTVIKESYESKVAIEALNRAGKCPNLKGHVHEILYKDKFNINPSNILKNQKAVLTKSNTAKMKDIIILKNNKVAGHAQLKDTISKSGTQKTIAQIKSGHYNKTRILGTTETTAKIQNKVSQPVHSSGISSNTTTRIANKALGKMPSTSALHNVGKAGGFSGAAISAGMQTVQSLYDVCNDKKTLGEASADIAVAGVKGGITGYSSAVAGSIAAGATGTAITATGLGTIAAGSTIGATAVAAAPVAIGLAAACVVGSAVSSFLSDLFD
ncbi:hypothetical protein QUV50_09795 [Phascolarctobacterium faecium]|nr:hypothetical protein [Phascolarctobacterium faecium]MDM8112075.1 hypothetical protein [Phascolarctobacterium faecium]